HNPRMLSSADRQFPARFPAADETWRLTRPAGRGTHTVSASGRDMYENAFNNIDRALRAEAGVATELDYAEQISWLLFLKYLDDLEAERANRAELEGKPYAPILDK